METPDGLEEERRLFYVALTRAKSEATLSCCEMRFKWGTMEFSSPSRFLQEIDAKYVECDDEEPASGFQTITRGAFGRDHTEGGYRNTAGSHATQQHNAGSQRSKGGSAIEELRRNFDYRFKQQREGERKGPNPSIVKPSQPSTAGMRRVITSPATDAASAGPCPYAIGDRVEHPKFGVGIINRIESLTTDHKVVVDFGQYGEKTLLAKFAKLTKL
jgi:DNA helicase-2/ATP-dependent DNA helicase PcrA